MKYRGKLGAFWGGVRGLLFESAFFLMPAIDPLLVAGPVVAWIIGKMEGAATTASVSVVGAGLFRIVIRKDSVLCYETAIKTGSYVLIVHGTAADVAHAQ